MTWEPRNPYRGRLSGSVGYFDSTPRQGEGLSGTVIDKLLRDQFEAGKAQGYQDAQDEINAERERIFEEGVRATLAQAVVTFRYLRDLAGQLDKPPSGRRTKAYGGVIELLTQRTQRMLEWVEGRSVSEDGPS